MNGASGRWIKRIVITLAALLVWELLYRVGLLNPLIFGAPSLMWSAAVKDGRAFVVAFQFTAYEIVAACAIAWFGGVAFGVIAGATAVRGRIFAPMLSAVIAVPLVVLYPIAIAWLGIGSGSKIAYGAVAGFCPVALATLYGIRTIDMRLAEMARAMGASRSQILVQVMTRLALPAIVSGLRIGTSLVIISVVQGEMLTSTDGLGFLISYHRALFNVGHVYIGILLVVLMAAAAHVALSALERHFGRWRQLQQAAEAGAA
jgi:NitT/TauT family transport system permease protein/taurine transport system permease protein